MEALNQCVENFSDENSARQQVTDVFDPLLNLLTGMIKFQRTYLAGKYTLITKTQHSLLTHPRGRFRKCYW